MTLILCAWLRRVHRDYRHCDHHPAVHGPAVWHRGGRQRILTRHSDLFIFNTVIGLYNIITYRPDIFKAFGPNYWFAFFLRNGRGGWDKLGGVVLCVTGAALCCCVSPLPGCSLLHHSASSAWVISM